MIPTGRVRSQIGTRSPGQVATLGRWTSTWIVLPANGYLIRNAPETNLTVEPNLWADVFVCVHT